MRGSSGSWPSKPSTTRSQRTSPEKTHDARRAVVGRVQNRYELSERRACRLVGVGRSTPRHRSRGRADEEALRHRLCGLAAERPRFGYRRLHALLRREGVDVNHKRTERLSREDGPAVRRRGRKRVARGGRGRAELPQRPHQRWGVDFVSGALARGRRIRLFTAVDVFTREALAIEVDTSLPGGRGVRVPGRSAVQRGALDEIVPDNGPGPSGKAVDRWAHERGVQPRFTEPGKPVQNAFVASFRGRPRDECLDRHRFPGLDEARRTVGSWRQDDDRSRPHSALAHWAPKEFRQAFRAAAITRRLRAGLL